MKHLTRRLFLQESLLAAAAVAVPSSAALAEAKTEPRKSPNERLSVAVIGVNGRGRDHAKAYAARGDCFLSYICDADSRVGQAAAERFESKPKFVQDMRRVFDDKSVDIVSIATPNHWHSLAAIWAMQAGKDVYVEKPVSHNISEGRRMVQTARNYNRICQAGTQTRSTGAARASAQYVHEGKLGQIKLAHVCTYRSRSSIGPAGEYPAPPTVDYNLWAGPAPVELPLRRRSFHYDWHWFWNWGGGELANNSIHPLDTVRMIVDLKGLGKGVLSYGGRVGLDDCGETPTVQVREEQNAEINEGHTSTAVVHVANISQRLGKPTSVNEIRQALDALNVNENVVETFEEIRRHLADNAVDIEKTPLALGPWIAIDSEKECFIDNPAANAMLTREYRKPFVVPAEDKI